MKPEIVIVFKETDSMCQHIPDSMCQHIPNEECNNYKCDECPYRDVKRIVIIKEDER